MDTKKQTKNSNSWSTTISKYRLTRVRGSTWVVVPGGPGGPGGPWLPAEPGGPSSPGLPCKDRMSNLNGFSSALTSEGTQVLWKEITHCMQTTLYYAESLDEPSGKGAFKMCHSCLHFRLLVMQTEGTYRLTPASPKSFPSSWTWWPLRISVSKPFVLYIW